MDMNRVALLRPVLCPVLIEHVTYKKGAFCDGPNDAIKQRVEDARRLRSGKGTTLPVAQPRTVRLCNRHRI